MAGDAIQGHVKSSALALRGGAIIGDKKSFLPGKAVMAWASSFDATYGNGGNWVNVRNRYLGLRFKVDGKIHYGWARLSVTIFLSNITTALTGYAYETVPNKPIIAGETKGPEYDRVEQSHSETSTMPAPETASLGLLATGSRALSIWRRREGASSGVNPLVLFSGSRLVPTLQKEWPTRAGKGPKRSDSQQSQQSAAAGFPRTTAEKQSCRCRIDIHTPG
jgi:hypothetical protein